MLAAQSKIRETVELNRLFPSSSIKVIKLLGYSSSNREQDQAKRYNKAKRPFTNGWQQMDKPGLSKKEENAWIKQGGWIGLVIPRGYIVVDIDDTQEGEILFKALLKDQLSFHAIKTVRGYQFFFKDNKRVRRQNATVLMACGCVGDYRLAEKGQVVLPSSNTKGREWVHSVDGPLSEMPIYFDQLKNLNKTVRPFPVPLMEGGRNDSLYKHTCRLVEFGYGPDEIHEITSFTNKYLFQQPLEHREYITTYKSALNKKPSGKTYGAPPSPPVPPVEEEKQPLKQEPKFNLTEMGNAERLVHRNGMNLRYCMEFESWMIWNGRTWKEDYKRQIERIAIKTFREMYGEAAKEEDDRRRNDLVKWAKTSERSSVFLNSINRTEAMLPISQDDLNKHKYLLNCANGYIDLKTGQLHSHDRKLFMTKNTNIPYDPNAECPTWMKFLESVFTDKEEVQQEVIDFLQKSIGYALTGDTSEQVVFFLWGTGRNGKSTFINTVKTLFGDYAKQTNSETFTTKYNDSGINNDVARLVGSRFVSAVESEDGQRLSESLIKQLTGGEPVTARFLRKEFFEFLPQFKIFFTTNYKPVIKGDDEGIWRRIRLVPFNVTIPKENIDKHLPEKLQAELPGILRWAVEGCLKWQKEGLGEPSTIKDATDAYKDEMDLLSNFINDACVVHPEAKIKLNDLYKEYLAYCEENSETPLKKVKFSNRLVMRGIEKRKSTGNQTFLFGIGLISNHSYLVTSSYSNSRNSPIRESREENRKTSNLKVTSNYVIEEDI
ncbi:phage/plasmid primase, P4 family [Niallia sp. 03091]|uniref:phage/plasmid primase, P4 family n=1 Tax=Niallia sp. 03091 TaxID=3458059 RepID=UPI0040450FFB